MRGSSRLNLEHTLLGSLPGVQHVGDLWLQEFLLAASQLAMTRAQTAANALADRIEELAIHATFVQASHSRTPFLYSLLPHLCLGGSRWACPGLSTG